MGIFVIIYLNSLFTLLMLRVRLTRETAIIFLILLKPLVHCYFLTCDHFCLCFCFPLFKLLRKRYHLFLLLIVKDETIFSSFFDCSFYQCVQHSLGILAARSLTFSSFLKKRSLWLFLLYLLNFMEAALWSELNQFITRFPPLFFVLQYVNVYKSLQFLANCMEMINFSI